MKSRIKGENSQLRRQPQLSPLQEDFFSVRMSVQEDFKKFPYMNIGKQATPPGGHVFQPIKIIEMIR